MRWRSIALGLALAAAAGCSRRSATESAAAPAPLAPWAPFDRAFKGCEGG